GTRVIGAEAVCRRGVGAGDGARRTQNRVGNRAGGRIDVQIAHAVEADTTAPDVGGAGVPVPAEGTLDSDVGLVGVRIAEILISKQNIQRARGRVEIRGREVVGIHRTRGELSSVGIY